MSQYQRYRALIERTPHTLVGLRATLVPHQHLGIARLEDMRGLVPSGQIDEERPIKASGAFACLCDGNKLATMAEGLSATAPFALIHSNSFPL
jgi:hypothetical protein